MSSDDDIGVESTTGEPKRAHPTCPNRPTDYAFLFPLKTDFREHFSMRLGGTWH